MEGVVTQGPLATRARILDVAERLFADRGFDVVSLRHITTEAAVNLAAVNYHFGSKDALIDEVIGRRLDPVNRRRLEMLAEAVEAAGGDSLSVETVLEAFFLPVVHVYRSSAHGEGTFFRLMGRCLAEGNERMNELMAGRFREVVARFTEAFERSLPGLTRAEVQLRLLFSAGSMIYALSHIDKLARFTEGDVVIPSLEELTRSLVGFTAAGFRAAVGGVSEGGGS